MFPCLIFHVHMIIFIFFLIVQLLDLVIHDSFRLSIICNG